MKKLIATVPVVFLLIAFIHMSCGSAGPTSQELRAACLRDFPQGCCFQSACPGGMVCDFSFVCAQGSNLEVTCDLPTGDRKCHSRCDAASSCPSGQTCKTLTLYDASDTGDQMSVCYSN
jgi:hypothetical protein